MLGRRRYLEGRSELKRLVVLAVSTLEWSDNEAGFVELDRIRHNGGDCSGDFANP